MNLCAAFDLIVLNTEVILRRSLTSAAAAAFTPGHKQVM